MIIYELSVLAAELPQGGLGLPMAPDPSPADFRGIAIHWWTFGLPKKNPERKLAPTVPIRQWQSFGVLFTTLSLNHTDTPPQTLLERDRYINDSVAIVQAHYEIPAPKTVAWELRLGEQKVATAQMRVTAYGTTT